MGEGREKALTGTKVRVAVELLVTADASVGRVLRDDQAVGAQGLAGLAAENVALDEDLVVGARVDGLVEEVLVEVVVDVLAAEAAGGAARAHVLPPVVVVGDVQLAGVDVAEIGVVADQRGLPLW